LHSLDRREPESLPNEVHAVRELGMEVGEHLEEVREHVGEQADESVR
jgi:hypothetical protein